MKGWSFNGLVKALKTAAFKDVGTSVGQIPLVGDEGMLSNPKVVDGADFNNINYKSGATFLVKPPYENWPFTYLSKKAQYFVKVDVGNGLSGVCSLRALQLDGRTTASTAQRDTNMVWSSSTNRVGRSLTNEITPNSLNRIEYWGDWYQSTSMDALPELGYPIRIAGVLNVEQGAYGGVIQRYTVYSTGATYVRGTTNSDLLMSPWVELVRTGVGQHCSFGRLTSQRISTVTQPSKWSDPFEYPEGSPFSVRHITVGAGDFLPALTQKCVLGGVGYPTSSTIGQQALEGNFANTVLVIRGDRGGETIYRFNIQGVFSVTTPKGRSTTFATEEHLAANYSTASALGAYQETPCWSGCGHADAHHWVLTSSVKHNQDDYADTVGRRPLHCYVGALGWVVFQSV